MTIGRVDRDTEQVGFLTLYFSFSLRHIRLRPLRHALAVFGVALGVAVFLSARLLESAAVRSARAEFESVLGPDRVVVTARNSDFHTALAGDLENLKEVQEALPYIQHSVLVAASGQAPTKLLVIGVPTALSDRMGLSVRPGVLRSTRTWMARNGVEAGHGIEVFGARGVNTALLGEPIKDFPLTEFHGGVVAVTEIDWLANLLSIPGKANRIDLTLEDGTDPAEASAAVKSGIGEAFDVHHPRENVESYGHTLTTYRKVLEGYAWLALLIGALSAASAIWVSISVRMESIGLLRALGASRSLIGRICIAESLLVSFVGVLLGIPTAFYIALVLAGSAAETMGALSGAAMIAGGFSADISDLSLAAACGAFAGLFGGLLPAWHASTVPPLESLRPGTSDGNKVTVAFARTIGRLSETAVLWRLALLSLCHKTARRLPAMLVLAAGFGLFAFFSTISSSLKETVGARYARLYQPDLIVFPRVRALGGRDGAMSASLKEEVAAIEGVEQAIGIRERVIEFEGEPVMLRAYDEPKSIIDFKMVDSADRKVTEAAADLFYSSDVSVFVSTGFTSKFGKKRDDKFPLFSPTGTDTARVIGSAYDLSFSGGVIGISRSWYRVLWDDSSLSELLVQVDRNFDANAIAEEIYARFGKSRGVLVESNDELREGILGAVDRAFLHLRVLEWCALLLGVFVLMNSMLAEVVDKRREQGVLRAIGMSRAQLERLVLIESSIQGLGSAILGCVAGTFFGAVVLENVISPVLGWSTMFSFSPALLGVASLLAMAVSVLGGILPARYAGRLQIRSAIERL